jgi:hypothetical protein
MLSEGENGHMCKTKERMFLGEIKIGLNREWTLRDDLAPGKKRSQ